MEAPTGVEMPLEEVEDIIRHNPDVIVIVDEAYVDFGGQSAHSDSGIQFLRFL